MAARLGQVLYYFFATLAVLVAFVVFGILRNPGWSLMVISLILLVVLYAIGSACRYVLAIR